MSKSIDTEVTPRAHFEQEALVHLDALYSFALKLSRARDEAEDLVSDTVLRAFERWEQYRLGTNIRAWLFTIVRNCCRTAQSGKAGAVSLIVTESSLSEEAAAQLSNHPDPEPGPEEELLRKVDVAGVRSAVVAVMPPLRRLWCRGCRARRRRCPRCRPAPGRPRPR